MVFPSGQRMSALGAMLLLGALGGAAYALIPAVFRTRFGASEILTSLMLVYVAELLLDYLTRGPWRDPKGFNFPTTAEFDSVASMPILISASALFFLGRLAIVRNRAAGTAAQSTAMPPPLYPASGGHRS